MSISFNHPSNTMTATDSLTISVSGGTITSPKPIRLNAISAVMPKSQQPAGESGAMYFDITSGTMKYYNGSTWVEWLDRDTLLSPIEADLSAILATLGTKVDSVTYSSSAVPTATISGTNLNIVFPNGTASTGEAGLFTALPAGSISYYSLVSGQSLASVREQMGGATGSQSGRSGTQASPYITKTGWCLSDGAWWTWQGVDGTVTKQVPALNNTAAYLKSTGTDGVTKTDTAIVSSGTIGGTSLSVDQLPAHAFSVTGTTNTTGSHVHTFELDAGEKGGGRAEQASVGVSGYGTTQAAGDHAHTVTGSTNTLGSGTAHTHALNNVDVTHFNVAVLYNIAEPAVALSETAGDARYVLKSGDTMTGSLTVASSLSLNDSQANLVMWFRNAAGTERAAIYHSSSTSTLRLRSNGGTEVSISNSGLLTAPAITSSGALSAASGTIASKTIVTSINNTVADSSGNVTLSLGDVTDVRLGAEITTSRSSLGSESFTYRAPTGNVVTGFDINSQSSREDNFTYMYSRPVQIQVGGVWRTISNV